MISLFDEKLHILLHMVLFLIFFKFYLVLKYVYFVSLFQIYSFIRNYFCLDVCSWIDSNHSLYFYFNTKIKKIDIFQFLPFGLNISGNIKSFFATFVYSLFLIIFVVCFLISLHLMFSLMSQTRWNSMSKLPNIYFYVFFNTLWIQRNKKIAEVIYYYNLFPKSVACWKIYLWL